jgi:AcrR family transcriptional regulator
VTPDPTAAASVSQRRHREVCQAALRVIVRKGLEETTLRDISREGGFTTGVVTHHFVDKNAVIRGAFALASEDWWAEVSERLTGSTSVEEQLRQLVLVAVPGDERRRVEWRLWAEMWTYAARHPEFVADVVDNNTVWTLEIRGVLERARAAGVVGDIDIDAEASALAAMIDGLGLRAWLSGKWSESRRDLVAHLGTLGVPPKVLERMLAPAESGR